MAKIDKKMSFTEVIQKYPKTGKVFDKYGMHCVGCYAAMFETVEQGAAAHGINADKLVKELNAATETKAAKKKASKKKTPTKKFSKKRKR